MVTLKNHIKENYGSVYRAAKELGRTETQLRNWIKKDTVIVDGEVLFNGGKLERESESPANNKK